MAFGIYIHIPYCIQRCSYCDFATYEKSSILPPSEYIEFLKKEIHVYGPLLIGMKVDTVYFGGGTPSLIEAELLVSVLETLKKVGFRFVEGIEITMEINPATIDEEKLKIYLEAGINRFSVGAQTFRNDLLKSVGRQHSAKDTQKTLELLSNKGLNYTFDLLFALPGQTKKDLERDLDWVKYFAPNHLSAYCLTVQDGHPLSKMRLPELEQIEMFDVIETELGRIAMDRYEISNFAKAGFESKHNLIYWTDENYWGAGLGAHSYIKDNFWGKRFWNPNNIQQYTTKITKLPNGVASSIISYRENEQYEELTENQTLTDYCHIFLRIKKGLCLENLEVKFGKFRRTQVETILKDLQIKGYVEYVLKRWRLSKDGVLVSNRIFEACTFLD